MLTYFLKGEAPSSSSRSILNKPRPDAHGITQGIEKIFDNIMNSRFFVRVGQTHFGQFFSVNNRNLQPIFCTGLVTITDLFFFFLGAQTPARRVAFKTTPAKGTTEPPAPSAPIEPASTPAPSAPIAPATPATPYAPPNAPADHKNVCINRLLLFCEDGAAR